MNLGDHVGDAPADVVQNRLLLAQAIQAKPVFMAQVHGVEVLALPGAAELDAFQNIPADACMTDQPGVACTILVADCLPVLFTDRQGTSVGAAHAGWRGLLGHATTGAGVLEQLYREFVPKVPMDTEHTASKNIADQILVWLGPCIGPHKFEVGTEVRDAFVAQTPAASSLFKVLADGRAGKWLADLPGLARLRLNALGITQIYGNDGGDAWCTVSQPSRFFSHRRDSVALGGSGRMAACIWLDKEG